MIQQANRAFDRRRAQVSAAFPAGVHRRFGALIESVGPTPAQIVVERAMYANDDAGVVWAAGTNAVATKLK